MKWHDVDFGTFYSKVDHFGAREVEWALVGNGNIWVVDGDCMRRRVVGVRHPWESALFWSWARASLLVCPLVWDSAHVT